MSNIEQNDPGWAEREQAKTAASVRAALIEAGHEFPEERTPAHTIPVRYWPNAIMSTLGYLDVYEIRRDGEGLTYDMTFRAGPLADGERPLYELRIDQAQEADRV